MASQAGVHRRPDSEDEDQRGAWLLQCAKNAQIPQIHKSENGQTAIHPLGGSSAAHDSLRSREEAAPALSDFVHN